MKKRRYAYGGRASKMQKFASENKGLHDVLKTGTDLVGMPVTMVTGESFSDTVGFGESQTAVGNVADKIADSTGKVAYKAAPMIAGAAATAIGGPVAGQAAMAGMKGLQGITSNDANKMGNAVEDGIGAAMGTNTPMSFENGGLLTQFEGPQHESGGVALGQNIEVEGGETRSNVTGNTIHSDKIKVNRIIARELNLPDTMIGKSLADVTKFYESKAKRPNDKFEQKELAENLARVEAITQREAERKAKSNYAKELKENYGVKSKLEMELGGLTPRGISRSDMDLIMGRDTSRISNTSEGGNNKKMVLASANNLHNVPIDENYKIPHPNSLSDGNSDGSSFYATDALRGAGIGLSITEALSRKKPIFEAPKALDRVSKTSPIDYEFYQNDINRRVGNLNRGIEASAPTTGSLLANKSGAATVGLNAGSSARLMSDRENRNAEMFDITNSLRQNMFDNQMYNQNRNMYNQALAAFEADKSDALQSIGTNVLPNVAKEIDNRETAKEIYGRNTRGKKTKQSGK